MEYWACLTSFTYVCRFSTPSYCKTTTVSCFSSLAETICFPPFFWYVYYSCLKRPGGFFFTWEHAAHDCWTHRGTKTNIWVSCVNVRARRCCMNFCFLIINLTQIFDQTIMIGKVFEKRNILRLIIRGKIIKFFGIEKVRGKIGCHFLAKRFVATSFSLAPLNIVMTNVSY